MTRIEFYVLAENVPQDRYQLTCRIAEKAWKSGKRVMIQTNSADEARLLDDALWHFRAESFVPHALLAEADLESTPVIIGWGTDARNQHEVLINLATQIPDFFSSFERVIEPVDQDPAQLSISREHYRFYRERGYPLSNQNITH
jgi:DNA polymerase-3 subunit chi